MKAIVKKQFQEFIDNIAFPATVYIYENGRIIASNNQARDIIGHKIKNIDFLWKDRARKKHSKQLLNNGSEVMYNRTIYCENDVREIDVEINSFILDKVHILVCLFEYSYKQCFVKHLRGQTPRILWMDKKMQYLGANYPYRKDLNFWEDFSEGFGAEEILDEETSFKVKEDQKIVMSTKLNQYNIIQSIKREQEQAFFARINRMPIINKNGTAVGLITTYNLILNREEYKRLFDNTLRENNILSQIVTKSETVIVSWVKEDNWVMEYISPNIAHFGYSVEDFYSKTITWDSVIHPEDREEVQATIKRDVITMNTFLEGKTFVWEYRVIKANKETAWVRCEIIPVYKNSNLTYLEEMVQDITDKKELEKELHDSKKALKLNYDSLVRVLNSIDSYVYVVNKMDNRILYVNSKVMETYIEEPIGQNCIDFLSLKGIEVSYSANYNQDLNFSLEEENSKLLYSEYYDRIKDRYLSVHTEEIEWSEQLPAMIISMHDVTATIEHQRNVEVQAFRDYLTGLPNRLKYKQDAVIAIEDAIRNNQQGYVFSFDLDDFKQINDGLGHEYGDILLKSIARYINEIPQLRRRCYRVGGDEFLIIVESKYENNLEDIMVRLFDNFRRPWKLHGKEYYCTMTMGGAIFPNDSTEPDELISFANLALFEAKREGKNRISYFKPGSDRKDAQRINLEKYLRKAITKGCLEFDVFYQPIIQMKDKSVVGAEALLRWHSPELGFVNPVDFISLSEYLGLIIPLGEFVMREAFIMCREWNEKVDKGYSVNINLSVAQLVQPNIVDRILELSRAVKVNPKNIIFEVSEGLAIEDINLMITVVRELKDNGFQIALDDFGTGYSSLNHIMEIPLDYIKIDKSFISSYGTTQFNPSLLTAIMDLAHSLNIQIIVEGVETKQQKEFLLFLNTDQYQGYLNGKPMPKKDLFVYLELQMEK